MMYKIVWVNDDKEIQGSGELCFNTKEEAQRFADRMDKKFPFIKHEVVEEDLQEVQQ